MSGIEWFLFFWIGMALVKWVIVLATFLDTIIEYERSKQSKVSIVGLFFSFIASGLLSIFAVLIFWPRDLFDNKTDYFLFPDKRMQCFLMDYLEKMNEN
ncbi:MAG: hypothetical protein H7839_03615 [Magnetococcus sp. YQC-5]